MIIHPCTPSPENPKTADPIHYRRAGEAIALWALDMLADGPDGFAVSADEQRLPATLGGWTDSNAIVRLTCERVAMAVLVGFHAEQDIRARDGFDGLDVELKQVVELLDIDPECMSDVLRSERITTLVRDAMNLMIRFAMEISLIAAMLANHDRLKAWHVDNAVDSVFEREIRVRSSEASTTPTSRPSAT